MKFTSRQMQYAVLALGVVLILFGAFNAMFDFNLDPKLESDISNYILIAAAMIFIYSRQLRTKENLAAKAEEEAEQTALEAKPADADSGAAKTVSDDSENSGDGSKS
jgi:hypothetical protein